MPSVSALRSIARTVSNLATTSSASVSRTHIAATAKSVAVLSFGLSGGRRYSTDLKTTLAAAIPAMRERMHKIKASHGDKIMGEVTVNMALGGMRGLKSMLWETSLLDSENGIRFRGYTIPELQKKLPTAKPNGEPLPEGILWLLLTGELPSKAQVDSLSAELSSRAELPEHVLRVLDALPAKAHPMTQFTCAIMAMQTESKFAAAYLSGMHKSEYWDPVFEDTLDCVAKLPATAAAIYRRSFKDGKIISPDPALDWAGNFAHMMGYGDEGTKELMRLYMTIHSDHEGDRKSVV